MEKSFYKKNWFVPFYREVVSRFDRADATRMAQATQRRPEGERFESWLEASLRRRGIFSGSQRALWPQPPPQERRKKRAEWLFVNTLSHQIELLMELRLVRGEGIDEVVDQLHILSILAASVGEDATAEALYELTMDESFLALSEEKAAKKLGPGARSLGAALKREDLPRWDHPLVGLPIHQVLIFADTQQLLQLAQETWSRGGRIDRDDIQLARATSQSLRLNLIEALLAMAYVDRVISAQERRFLQQVIELARLTEGEARMIWDRVEEPMSPDALAEAITTPRTRRFLFEQLALQAHFDGEVDKEESNFLDAVADAFGLTEATRLEHEVEAFSLLEKNPDLVEAFELGGLLQRYRNHVNGLIEVAVTRNLDKIIMEIKETGELGQLLIKRASGRLDAEEEAKVRAQIVDICKTIPALAVFAVPGGSVLLPVLIRTLPFDLLPSAFSDKDEALLNSSGDLPTVPKK